MVSQNIHSTPAEKVFWALSHFFFVCVNFRDSGGSLLEGIFATEKSSALKLKLQMKRDDVKHDSKQVFLR